MILSENFAKLAQHTELQLAVFLALHKHTKMLRLFFFARQGSRLVAERIFIGHSSVRKTCRITWFTLKQLSVAFVQLLFNMMQLSLVL